MMTGFIAGAIVFLFLTTIAFAVDPFTPFDFGRLAVVASLCLGWGAFWGWAIGAVL